MTKRRAAKRAPQVGGKRKSGPMPKAEIARIKGLIVAWRVNEVPVEQIARMLGCSIPTLRARFSQEMEFGPAIVEGEIVANLHKQLKSDDIRVVPGLLSYASKRIKAFAPAPALGGGSGHFGGGQVREMRFVIVNDPEEGLEEYRQEGQTVEVKGHDPNAPPSNIDPDPKEPGEV